MNYLGRIVVEATSLTVGKPPQEYTFPDSIGSLGDVLTSEANGKLVFSAAVNPEFVDQDVTMGATPNFAAVNTDTIKNSSGFRVIDKATTDVTHIHSGASELASPGYNIRCAVGSTRVNHGGDNTASYIECRQEEQLFKVAGSDKMQVSINGVTVNPYSDNSFTLPTTRGSDKQALVSDGDGNTFWETASSSLTIDNLHAIGGLKVGALDGTGFAFPHRRGLANQVMSMSDDGETVLFKDQPEVETYVLPDEITVDRVTATVGIQTASLLVGSPSEGYELPSTRGNANQIMAMGEDGATLLFIDQETSDVGVVYPYSFPSTVPPPDGRLYILASVAGEQGGYKFSTVEVASNEVILYYSAPSPRGSRNTILSWYAPQNWTGNAEEFAVLLQAGFQGLLGPATGATTISVIFLSGRFRSIVSVSGETRDHFWGGHVPLGALLGFPLVGEYAPEQIGAPRQLTVTEPTPVQWITPRYPGQFVYSVTAAEAREAQNTIIETSLVLPNRGFGFLGLSKVDLYPGYTFSVTVSGDIITDAPPGGLEFCLIDQYHSLSWPCLASHTVPIIRDITNIDAAMALANSISLNAAIDANQVALDTATIARIQMLSNEATFNNALATNGPAHAATISAQAAYSASTTALTAALMVVATTAETLAIVSSTSTGEPQINTYEWKMTCTYNAAGKLDVRHHFQYGYAYDSVAASFSNSTSAALETIDDIQFNITAQWSDAKVNNLVNLRSIVMARIM
jgi:hypothetical protein